MKNYFDNLFETVGYFIINIILVPLTILYIISAILGFYIQFKNWMSKIIGVNLEITIN